VPRSLNGTINQGKERKWKPLIMEAMICGYLVEVYQTFEFLILASSITTIYLG
jgi:hypothetical protein